MDLTEAALSAILGATLVIFGFLLAVWRDERKDGKHRAEERVRLANAIWAELTENGGKAEGMKKAIQATIAEPLDNEYTLTLSTLGVDAWQLALLHWDLLSLDENVRARLSSAHADGEHINALIQLREGFLIGQNLGVARLYDQFLLTLLDGYLIASERLAPEVMTSASKSGTARGARRLR